VTAMKPVFTVTMMTMMMMMMMKCQCKIFLEVSHMFVFLFCDNSSVCIKHDMLLSSHITFEHYVFVDFEKVSECGILQCVC